jgi:hypothetical protein
VAPERGELLVPVRLELVEPSLDVSHRLRPKSEDASTGIVGDALVGDEAGLEQYSQVAAHDRAGRARGSGELASTAGLVAKQLENAPAGRVSEHVEEIVLHVKNS